MPSNLVDAAPQYAIPPIVDFNDIDPVLSKGITSAEGAVVSAKSTTQREQMREFIGGNSAYRRESRFETGVSRFDLNHHDGSFVARNQIRLEAFRSPVTREYDDTVTLQKTPGDTLSPATV